MKFLLIPAFAFASLSFTSNAHAGYYGGPSTTEVVGQVVGGCAFGAVVGGGVALLANTNSAGGKVLMASGCVLGGTFTGTISANAAEANEQPSQQDLQENDSPQDNE